MKLSFRLFLGPLFFFLLLWLGVSPALGAQELDPAPGTRETGADPETVPPEDEAVPPSRDAEILELDIHTSSLMELAAWCRSLSLSEGGNREALASRLREYYKLHAPAAPEEGGAEGESTPKIITIESARSTEYFTLDVVDEEYARLRGDVVISLKDGDSVHRIKAWELLYNRSRNLLSATGGVEYIKESGDTIETFRGESITVDLDNWSSIFMDGVSERSLSGEETTYRFAGNIISRSAEEATVLTHAEISNAANEEAYWSISASKLWLLPGSDWAILNGFLKVGEIPVLYIPLFFFPSDEIIFHPVLGYRSRAGNFVQTTTYILGRPQASTSSESSITKILGNSTDMEKIQEGIFLRSTGKKSRDPNTTRLSAILDAYTNLGVYVGTDLALPKKGIFGDYNLSLGLGYTRDVVQIPENSVYTPFPRYDGTSDWNSSRIAAMEVPFRYRMTNTGSLSGIYGSFSWNLPYYSDPFVNRDFLDRSEEMDYIEMLKQGGAPSDTEEDITSNILGAYEWRLNGSSTLSLPKLAPYVTTLSISSLSSFVSFNTRTSRREAAKSNSVSPSRTFFYPDKFTIYSLSANIGGTPLTVSTGSQAAGTQPGTQPAPPPEEQDDPLRGFGAPASPWGAEKDASGTRGAQDTVLLNPPALSQRFDMPRGSGLRFSIAYQLTPSSASELKFRSTQAHWPEVEDIDWSEVSSILTSAKTDGSTTLSLSDINNAFTSTLRLSGSLSWQDYSFMDEEAEEYAAESVRNSAIIRAYGQTYFTTSSELTNTVRPFYRDPVWGSTNFQYTIKGLIAKSVLEGTKDNNPDDAYWDVVYGKWDKDSLETHRAAANIQASVRNKTQNLTLTADLPPEDSILSGDATVRVWISETNVSGKVRDPFDDPLYDPLRFTETLAFNSSLSASQNVVYDPEQEEFTSLTSNLSCYGFTASYTATYSTTYSLTATGDRWEWVQSTDPALNPREFKLGYNHTFKKADLWEKQLAFSVIVNTGLTFDLQRYTNSMYNFTLNFTLGISNFLDFTLGTSSANAVIFRYFRGFPLLDIPEDAPIMGEKNLFKDLINSFRFDDIDLRRSSGFKLKSFNMSLLHHLGDWTAKLAITLSPYLPPNELEYKFNNEVSFMVQWIPISEVKTEITRNKDKFEFK